MSKLDMIREAARHVYETTGAKPNRARLRPEAYDELRVELWGKYGTEPRVVDRTCWFELNIDGFTLDVRPDPEVPPDACHVYRAEEPELARMQQDLDRRIRQHLKAAWTDRVPPHLAPPGTVPASHLDHALDAALRLADERDKLAAALDDLIMLLDLVNPWPDGSEKLEAARRLRAEIGPRRAAVAPPVATG